MKFAVCFDYTQIDDDAEEFWDRVHNDPNFDQDAWIEAHMVVKEVELNCTDEDDAIERWMETYRDEIDAIETEYGILDVSGCGDEFGFDTYEISRENTDIAWKKLVALLREAGLVAE